MTSFHAAPRILWAAFACLVASGVSRGQPLESTIPADSAAARQGIAAYRAEHPPSASRDNGANATGATPLSPQVALTKFKTRPGLAVDLIAAEPDVAQPVNLTFDSRGWLWVTEYIQFPTPAGVKVVSYDHYLRAVFDRVPAPPPRGAKGADKVAVFEDRGDGTFVRRRDVITGLNLATSALKGAGGIWVLNPPYLLFYPDANDDGVPNGDPQVCLSGFGIQDTQSVASSLQFGPDGWIYGANGSTTTGLISSRVSKNVRLEGQHIWRYNPRTTVFETYGEGGGNTFSCEIDAQGRVFSGTNYAAAGMHYEQGMSGVKAWGKHGPAENPYAFGFFDHMETKSDGKRFSQSLCVYDGGLMTAEFSGHFISGNALQNMVYVRTRIPDTSTFKAVDEAPLLTSSDRWFRPTDVKVGPDGAIYLADWYESNISAPRPVDDWSRSNGRVYRVRPAGVSLQHPIFNLHTADPAILLALLGHPNKWFRRQAALELAWRVETSTLPELRKMARDEHNPHAFDALCALQMLGGLDDELAAALLRHPDPYVRRWVVRCTGDLGDASPRLAAALLDLAVHEQQPEVRTQLLASVKRLPAVVALPAVQKMMESEADMADRRLPLLLWWALEAKAETDRSSVLALFADPAVWKFPWVRRYGARFLTERWAMAGGKDNEEACAQLLGYAPTAADRALVIDGLALAFEGGSAPALPPTLASALDSYLQSQLDTHLALAVRTGNPGAVAQALAVARDQAAPSVKRAELIEALAEAGNRDVIPIMVRILSERDSLRLKEAIIPAAEKFDDVRLPQALFLNYDVRFGGDRALKDAADRMLTSRLDWARLFLAKIDRSVIDPEKVAPAVVQRLELYHDPAIDAVVHRFWPAETAPLGDRQKAAEQVRIKGVLATLGNPLRGRDLFLQRCSVCHTLFGEGGHIGPELTGYERGNLDFWLVAILDPSLQIREGFAAYLLKVKGGQTLMGMLVKQDGTGVAIRDLSGNVQTVKIDQVESLEALPKSIMPEGLLSGMSDGDLRNFFAYLTRP